MITSRCTFVKNLFGGRRLFADQPVHKNDKNGYIQLFMAELVSAANGRKAPSRAERLRRGPSSVGLRPTPSPAVGRPEGRPSKDTHNNNCYDSANRRGLIV